MSTTARLNELRAHRAAQALVDIHRAIDAAWLHDLPQADEETERLCLMRELAVMQLERLSVRVRRNETLRSAIEAACRSYRAWTAEDPGTDAEQRCADALSVSMIGLRSALGPLVPRPEPTASTVLLVGPPPA